MAHLSKVLVLGDVGVAVDQSAEGQSQRAVRGVLHLVLGRLHDEHVGLATLSLDSAHVALADAALHLLPGLQLGQDLLHVIDREAGEAVDKSDDLVGLLHLAETVVGLVAGVGVDIDTLLAHREDLVGLGTGDRHFLFYFSATAADWDRPSGRQAESIFISSEVFGCRRSLPAKRPLLSFLSFLSFYSQSSSCQIYSVNK